MRASTFLLASVFSALTAGCNFHDDTMGDHAAALDDHMSAFEAEMAGHGTAIEAAPDLGRVASMEDEHLAGGRTHLDGMQHEMGDMMACAGTWQGMSRTMMDMENMRAACDAHREAMRNAPDMAAARAEEGRHQEAMAEMMGDTRMDMGSMPSGTGGMMCDHHR